MEDMVMDPDTGESLEPSGFFDTYHCDTPGCGESFGPHDRLVAARLAERAGWGVAQPSASDPGAKLFDFCPDHALVAA